MGIKRLFAVGLILGLMLGMGVPAGGEAAAAVAPRIAAGEPSLQVSIVLPMTAKVVVKRIKTWELTQDSDGYVYVGRKSTVAVKGTRVTGKIALDPSDPITFSGKRHLGKKTITIIEFEGDVRIEITFASARSRKAVKVKVAIE